MKCKRCERMYPDGPHDSEYDQDFSIGICHDCLRVGDGVKINIIHPDKEKSEYLLCSVCQNSVIPSMLNERGICVTCVNRRKEAGIATASMVPGADPDLSELRAWGIYWECIKALASAVGNWEDVPVAGDVISELLNAIHILRNNTKIGV